MQDVFVLFTMDCEPARTDVTPYASEMSGSGPAGYDESERSIRGYVAALAAHGYPTTLFVHPEVAIAQPELLLGLQDQGACLGLHLHPYKFDSERYRCDLGAYSASVQRQVLEEAAEVWEGALGQKPRYFRGGYFSANDSTFHVLQELGFRGGSLSIPGRVLPEHCSVWAGANPYPHRAHVAFRQLSGDSPFVEVPVSVDFRRPVAKGVAGEQGYEWPYVPARSYDHQAVVEDILQRLRADSPCYGTLVADSHNDQDYSDLDHPARMNLDILLDSIDRLCGEMGMHPAGVTLDALCAQIRTE